ncbi:MAG: acyltransferase [Bacteroidales bacterium]|nr:acyltransferase [Bacteroidales bacterium]MDY2917377.1 acyltransferase [Muribaculaceae bacterium]
MTTDNHIQSYPAEFADIAPYNETNYYDKLVALTHEPGFEHAIRYIMPDIDYEAFCRDIVSVGSQREFQERVMGRFLANLEKLSTAGITSDGVENVRPGMSYTFISNHRDIVLDAAFLNLVMLRGSLPVTQIAIGNNLLIMDWITDLVKINRSFIVKRDVQKMEALRAAQHLSAYIRYTISQMHESLWIAQRQGRAKDSNDRTQESLVKMLTLAGGEDTRQAILDVNLMPVSISYEYDPNDYLKVREFLCKRRDPDFHKSQHDDLLSMETGMLGFKGRVHFSIAPCINDALEQCRCSGRAEAVHTACRLIDNAIHRGYFLYPINYIAYDVVNNTDRYADRYTAEDRARAEEYVASRLAKVDLPHITDEEREYMRMMMLTMYANPVRNQEAARS